MTDAQQLLAEGEAKGQMMERVSMIESLLREGAD